MLSSSICYCTVIFVNTFYSDLSYKLHVCGNLLQWLFDKQAWGAGYLNLCLICCCVVFELTIIYLDFSKDFAGRFSSASE